MKARDKTLLAEASGHFRFRVGGILVLMLLSTMVYASAACAAPFTVTNTSAAHPTCEVSLQTLVDAAAPGAVVEAAGGCVYRETVRIDKPLILQAGPEGSEIRGSEIWDDVVWSQQGSTWVSSKAVPRLVTESRWQCEPNTSRCRWPEQVFIDGGQLAQVIGSKED